MDRRELAELTGYSEAQIVLWELGRAALPDRADKALPCARRYPEVAAVLGAPRPLITPASQAQCGCFLLPSFPRQVTVA